MRITYLDGWRGIAIICVLMGHFSPLSFINMGSLGVELFFVLSGRLMADILFIKEPPLPLFYKKRFSRIYPTLFIFALVCGALKYFTSPTFDPKTILMALSFTYNYNIWIPQEARSRILENVWSLCVEEHAYIILGAIAYFYRRARISIILVTGAIALAAMLNGMIGFWVFNNDFFHTYWRTDVRISSIFMACAVYLATRGIKSQRIPAVALIAGLILNLDFIPYPIHFTLGTICLSLAVSLIDHAPAKLKQLLSYAPLSYMGVVSYSVYLWQQPFYIIADHHGGTLFTAGMLGTGIVTGLISYYLLETPARNWINAKGIVLSHNG